MLKRIIPVAAVGLCAVVPTGISIESVLSTLSVAPVVAVAVEINTVSEPASVLNKLASPLPSTTKSKSADAWLTVIAAPDESMSLPLIVSPLSDVYETELNAPEKSPIAPVTLPAITFPTPVVILPVVVIVVTLAIAPEVIVAVPSVIVAPCTVPVAVKLSPLATPIFGVVRLALVLTITASPDIAVVTSSTLTESTSPVFAKPSPAVI